MHSPCGTELEQESRHEHSRHHESQEEDFGIQEDETAGETCEMDNEAVIL